MQAPRFNAVKVGDQLPPLALPAINRTTLALYCGASGDHNPIHIDLDFARKARMPDVFAHGMLSAAYLGRLLTGWVPHLLSRPAARASTSCLALRLTFTVHRSAAGTSRHSVRTRS